MSLPIELISEFVKATKDDAKAPTESIVHGTIVFQNGTLCVQIDGSSIATPVATTADIREDQEGDRVMVMIKNHTATITGNITSPSPSSVVVRQIAEGTSEVVNDYNSVKAEIATTNKELGTLKESVSGMNVLSDEVAIWIEQVYENGVEEVKTSTGYTFDKDGLQIGKEGEELSSEITNEGFYVDRKDANVLTADADGVNALNVKVRKYLVVGDHLRIEKYNNGTDSKRTAFFWLPGN